MSGYLEALGRLTAYGKRMNLSKTELSQLLGLHQNNFHEHEIGKRMISEDNLKTFKKNGGDLYYLITGRECVEGPVGNIFSMCHSDEQKKLILNLLLSNMEYAAWMDGVSVDEIFYQLHKALKLFDGALLTYSLWLRIRKLEYLNQDKMAMRLGIEERQYRRIEKGGSAAWAVLCELERNLNYSPLLFLDRDQYFVDELNYCWGQLSKSSQEYIMERMQEAIKLAE